jgi:hypothetical protein
VSETNTLAAWPVIELADYLGIEPEPLPLRFAVYLPDRDRLNHPVGNIESYIEAFVGLFTRLARGATRLPWAEGAWEPPPLAASADGEGPEATPAFDIGGREQSTVVYTFVNEPRAFFNQFDEVVALLRHFAKGANQREILLELSATGDDGYYHYGLKVDCDQLLGVA